MSENRKWYWHVLNTLITIACMIIVGVQFHACWARYIKYPKLTEVSIQHASKYPTPEVTFCLSDYGKFNETLPVCNMKPENYFPKTEYLQPIWQSSGNVYFCANATKLYEALMVDPKWLLNEMVVKFFDPNVNEFFPSGSELKGNEFWKFKEDLYRGRCYTFNPQIKVPIQRIETSTQYPARFYIHPPGNFFSLDSRLEIYLGHRNHDIEANVAYEVFEGLNQDQDDCTSDLDRDTCIDDYLFKNLTQEVGCTTPFAKNQTVICTDTKLALKAWKITNELLFRNPMEMMKHCPKSCTQVQPSFASYRESNTSASGWKHNHLILDFKQFVKVSKTDYSYTFLSFLADVGAFVALFLGTSVNQIGYYLETIWNAMKRKLH